MTDIYEFRINVADNKDIKQCWEVVILSLVGYCCCAVFKKMKSNSCQNLISGRDNLEEMPEIINYF